MKLLWCFVLAGISLCAQVSPTINELPSREFGQPQLSSPITTAAPNLVEGRELNSPVAVAFSSSGGAMYVADTSNNRVLAWLNPAGLTKGNHADKVIGQRDFYTTLSQGPGKDLSSGLSLPTSITVDGSGSLYVVDSGNNRVVRYPNPFNQTSSPLQIDLVIGQKTASSGNAPNEGQPQPAAKTLSFTPGNRALLGAVALDAQGNLWVADAGNNRVLRFPVSQLAAGTIEPAADLVLGQTDFISNGSPNCSNCQLNFLVLLQPQSLAFDSTGALYIADGYARVLYYPTPNSGVSASKVLGVPPTPGQGQQPKPFPNDYGLGNNFQNSPLSVFTNGNAVFVADTLANRVVRFNSAAQYNPTATAPSPQIQGVVGQPDLLSGKVNHGLVEPDATALAFPSGGAFDAVGNLWVVDGGNNRLLSYPANGSFTYTSANVVVGQTDFPFNSPNLIEGREVWLYNSAFGGGLAVDKSSNPPHLYIADTFNNRILGFLDARAVGVDARSLLTQKADVVIGQPDLSRAMVNYPNGDKDLPTSTGLFHPVGLAVDDSGGVWVADSGNGRVLHFPAPFSVAAGTLQTADTVLGQTSFTQKDVSASQQTMNGPYGLALFPDGHLAVSDVALNRVLVFRKPFSNGASAFTVVGQPSYSSNGSSATLAGLNSPRHLATDTSGRLYVCDLGNNRVVVYRDTSAIAQIGPAAAFNFSNVFSAPQAIAVSQVSGEMWVGAGTTIYHLPEVTSFQNTSTIFQQISSNVPLTIALDSFENPIVAEAINRITFYFAKLAIRNAFTFTSTRPLTPGMWVQAAPIGKAVNVADEVHETPPYPKTVAGLQMLVNGAPSGIYAVVQKSYINFVIPWSAPTSGNAEFLLFNPTTHEIVAAGTMLMAVSDPAFKTANGAGTGQVLAANVDDGGLNGPQNPATRGKVLQLALTGQGLVNNPPPDGVAPSGLVPTNPADLHVFINGLDVPAQNILFSGLDPTYPGSWIINVRIPDISQNGPPPGNAIPIIVTMRDVASNYGYDPSNSNNDITLNVQNGRVTTIAVK